MMTTEQTLSPHEATILLAFTGADAAVALPTLAQRSGLGVAQTRSAVERLKMRGSIEQTAEQIDKRVTLNEFGQQCRGQQIPEWRLVKELIAHGGLPVQAVQRRDDLDRAEAGAAFGALRRSGVLVIDNNEARLAANADMRELQARQHLVEQIGASGEVTFAELAAAEQARIQDKRLHHLFQLHDSKVCFHYRRSSTAQIWGV